MTTAREFTPDPGADQPLLSIEAAAELLGVEVRWMRRAVAERRIAFHKIGHYVRFDREDLRAFVASARVEPFQPSPPPPWAVPLHGHPGRPGMPPQGTRRPGDRRDGRGPSRPGPDQSGMS